MSEIENKNAKINLIVNTTKSGSLKRQYLLAKNMLYLSTKTNHDYYFIADCMKKLINELDELILFEIEDK